MKAAYRDSRVSVSKEIKSTIIELIKKEQDTQKKKKHPANWYRDEVAKTLNLKDENNPSLRSYEEAIRKLKKKLVEPNPLDQRWTLGACSAYSQFFPPDSLSLLMDYKKYFLTIRHAIWIVRLRYLVAEKYPQKEAPFWISSAYARAERFSQMVEKKAFDTTELDKTFFTESKSLQLAVLESWGLQVQKEIQAGLESSLFKSWNVLEKTQEGKE